MVTTMHFDDGVSFRTSGELRIETRPDGYYVVGRGLLCAVDSRIDGLRLIKAIGGEDQDGKAVVA